MSDFSLLNMLKKHREIIAYIICGALTTFVSLVTYYLLSKFIFDVNVAMQLQTANIISWIISVLFAFVTNKVFVFNSKASALKEIIKFYLARISTLFVDMLLMYLLVTLWFFNDMLAKGIVTVVVIVLNYVFGKKMVFTKG